MFAGCIISAVFIVIPLSAKATSTNDVTQEKRVSSMGFEKTRVEKDYILPENDKYSKRALMGFQGMRGKKIVIGPDIIEEYLFENAKKRATMGFQGMRGKKEYSVPLFEDPHYNGKYNKRAPMFSAFQGVRGKKTISEDEFNKRSPSMSFVGMRGKKSFKEILEDLEKRALKGFRGVRGGYRCLFENPGGYEKKALAMGFQGMRGKRGQLNDDWEKRARMRFQGMRVRKNSLSDV